MKALPLIFLTIMQLDAASKANHRQQIKTTAVAAVVKVDEAPLPPTEHQDLDTIAVLVSKALGVIRSQSVEGFAIQKTPPLGVSDTLNVLCLDTGDSYGLSVAFELAVLDHILRKNGKTLLNIFPVYSATSMGCLITAFLTHKDPSKTKSALDILRFFYHDLPYNVFGFDECSDQLRDNLLALLGTSTVKDSFAHHVYLYAATNSQALCFTNDCYLDPLNHQTIIKPENTRLIDTLRGAIARESISASTISSDAGGHIEVEDGTPYADAQAISVYEQLSLKDASLAIFSFGLGHNAKRPLDQRRAAESALSHGLKTLLNPRTTLSYLAELQPPLLEHVRYDSTDPHTKRHLVEVALQSLQSDAFQDMLNQLGVRCPKEEITQIGDEVMMRMKALSSKDFRKLSGSEIKRLREQIQSFDHELMIERKCYYFDQGNVHTMTPEEYSALMLAIAEDAKALHNTVVETSIVVSNQLRTSLESLPKLDKRSWDLLKRIDPSEAQDYFRMLEGDKWREYFDSLKERIDGFVECVAPSLQDKAKASTDKSSPNFTQQAAAGDDFDDLTESDGEERLVDDFEKAILETREANNVLILFMQGYLTFLNRNGYMNHSAENIELASMVYLRATLGDEVFVEIEGLKRLSSSIDQVIQTIITSKDPTGITPEWLTRFISSTRYSSLHKALEHYIATYF